MYIPRKKIYLGYHELSANIFRSEVTPTKKTHPYLYVVGPFRTIRGAKAMMLWGQNNPHIQCVDDAEKIGKIHQDELREHKSYSRSYYRVNNE